MITLKYKTEKGSTISLVNTPNICPECSQPTYPEVEFVSSGYTGNNIYVTLRCNHDYCLACFVYKYEKLAFESYSFERMVIGKRNKKTYSEYIQKISPSFCAIYNEAFAAEQFELMQICGVGFRKSLEFLIKDYVLSKHPDKEIDIKGKFLSTCIKEYLKDSNIEKTAKRATWLGNDETHYVRIWEDKDLKDLKKLIDLTIHWIESELETEELNISMPDSTKN